MLDSDLAELYQVLTKNLNLAVKRNLDRFPADFMFQLTKESRLFEVANCNLKRESRRPPVLAIRLQGVAMLSSVLNNSRTVQVNIAIMRAFVQLRQLAITHKDLAEKIAEMEKK